MFDADSSGQIEFDEFRQMLPLLGLHLDTAKAIKYFRLVDSDESGAISKQELREALFIIDPSYGNPVGFRPSTRLGPDDAFALFDKDASGGLDEDEFVFALEYLGYRFDLEDEDLIERMFGRYDIDRSGVIDTIEFRKLWLDLCDVKAELAARGISNLSEQTTRVEMQKTLEELIVDERRKELESLRQARAWIGWRAVLKTRRRLIRRARRRALRELGRALDCAGQVYIFGNGSRGGFDGLTPVAPIPTAYHDDLYNIWRSKLRPGGLQPSAGAAAADQQLKTHAHGHVHDASKPSANSMSKGIRRELMDSVLARQPVPGRPLDVFLRGDGDFAEAKVDLRQVRRQRRVDARVLEQREAAAAHGLQVGRDGQAAIMAPIADGRLDRCDIRRYPHLNTTADPLLFPLATKRSAAETGVVTGETALSADVDDSDALSEEGLYSGSDDEEIVNPAIGFRALDPRATSKDSMGPPVGRSMTRAALDSAFLGINA